MERALLAGIVASVIGWATALGCAGVLAHLVGNDRPPVVECHAERCATDDEAFAAFLMAERYLPGWDATTTTLVRWFPEAHVFGYDEEGRAIVGFSRTPHETTVTSWRVLGHEIVHLHLWRMHGNPDRMHRGLLWGHDEEMLKDALADAFWSAL